jgi:hypothetical protein
VRALRDVVVIFFRSKTVMTQQNRPEIKVRATRPSDGILYERNEFIAYWLEEGDLENFLDHPPDSINGCCGNTEQEALEAAQKHWTIREENHRRNREKFHNKYGYYPE